MLLIAASWIVHLLFFLIFGIAARYILNTRGNTILTLFFGMVFQTILITISAFFIRIGLEFFIVNSILLVILGFVFRKEISSSIIELRSEFRTFSNVSKAIFGIILISALFRCAQSPFILDNESYYVQTIKWLNEHGFVKGLANLNVAYGQTSGWHIFQSGFNFSFLTDRLNDINGLLFILCSFYFLSIFEQNYREKYTFHWIIFILIFNVLTFQFLDSPSPDLPLFLISQVLFYLFLKENRSETEIKTIIVLFIFLAFIKITILPLGILLVPMLLKHKKTFITLIGIGIIFGILWVAKNSILIGYPFYPFKLFALDFDWKLSENMLGYINNMVRNHEFMRMKGYKTFSLWQKFQIWIGFSGINGLFNKGILLLFILVPFTKMMRSLNFRILYFALLVHFIIVFTISPQFRFFLAEFIFLSVVIFADIVNRFKIKKQSLENGLAISVILPFLSLFFFNPDIIKQQNSVQKSANPTFSQILLPEPNSKFDEIEFVKIRIGNLEYHSPKKSFFFYGTANGPLPCMNKKAMHLFGKKYHSVPQLRTKKIEDGFYSINPDSIK